MHVVRCPVLFSSLLLSSASWSNLICRKERNPRVYLSQFQWRMGSISRCQLRQSKKNYFSNGVEEGPQNEIKFSKSQTRFAPAPSWRGQDWIPLMGTLGRKGRLNETGFGVCQPVIWLVNIRAGKIGLLISLAALGTSRDCWPAPHTVAQICAVLLRVCFLKYP